MEELEQQLVVMRCARGAPGVAEVRVGRAAHREQLVLAKQPLVRGQELATVSRIVEPGEPGHVQPGPASGTKSRHLGEALSRHLERPPGAAARVPHNNHQFPTIPARARLS
jgi:hypothetical protein